MGIPKTSNFLIVDDLPSIREFLSKSLKELGFAGIIYQADGVKSALNIIEEKRSEGKEPVDFVITDWLMPDQDGSDLLFVMKSDARLKTIPVLILSSDNKRETVLKSIKGGANGYLLKPWTPETLTAKIEKAWDHAKQ